MIYVNRLLVFDRFVHVRHVHQYLITQPLELLNAYVSINLRELGVRCVHDMLTLELCSISIVAVGNEYRDVVHPRIPWCVALSITQEFFSAILRNALTHAPAPTSRCSSKMKKQSVIPVYLSILFQESTVRTPAIVLSSYLLIAPCAASLSQSRLSRFLSVVMTKMFFGCLTFKVVCEWPLEILPVPTPPHRIEPFCQVLERLLLMWSEIHVASALSSV